jgi:hypothetical protein
LRYCARRVLHVLPGGKELFQPPGHFEQLVAGLLFDIDHHFADGEQPDAQRHELDTVRQLDLTHREARRPGEEVQAHSRQQESEYPGDQTLELRGPREQHHQAETKNHEPRVLGWAEDDGEFGDRRGEER